MLALLAATLIWAFSFGIIKTSLSEVPWAWSAFVRLACAALVFAPFAFRGRPALPPRRLALIGAVQFGLMYVLYFESFAHLDAWEVALFTAFTPIWVLLLAGLRQRDGTVWQPRAWIAVLACVGGAALMRADPEARPGFDQGFLLVQGANLCFAYGQVAYRQALRGVSRPQDAASHAWMFLGALLVAGVAVVFRVDDLNTLRLTQEEAGALLFLGAVASGLGFALWNAGARRVHAGLLATANNLKIPVAVAVSVLFFGEALEGWQQQVGGGVILVSVLAMLRRPAARPA